MKRYINTNKINNDADIYYNLLERKKLNYIKQYKLFSFKNLSNNRDISFINHTVSGFETIEKISNRYYSSPEYGWIILYVNNIPSELHLKINDIIKIYYPLNFLLSLFNEGT